MLANGHDAAFLDMVYGKYNEYQAKHQMVVIDCWKRGSPALNAKMAAHMDAPAILVVDQLIGEDTTSMYDRAVRPQLQGPVVWQL